MLLPIHVAAGGLATVPGGVALSVNKGGTAQRRSGLLFVGARGNGSSRHAASRRGIGNEPERQSFS